ncbi:MAG: efflux RND transporter periplasmic adaptor subunit [Tannerellaceae bacterium]|jgi:cobalt-zinc-cadmium efflux system membrane fusion protein|nr:efflux RND transporter periplasmic adaptor subunit [Tannerellaceae bacterium]
MNKLFIAIGVCSILASCKQDNSADGSAGIRLKGDTIVVSEDAPVLKQIFVQKTSLQDFSAEFRTVGTVRPVSGKLAEIAPPFAGRIVKSFVRLGQKVSAGSPVFELGSPAYYEATKSYFATQSANALAGRNYRRLKELAANGVASQRELDEAESEAHIAGQEFEQAKATLQLFNTDAASLQMGQPLQVVSPIQGEVVKNRLTIGSYAREDSEPLVVVADMSQVWVTALVKEKYLGAIEHGDRVEIYTNAHPGKVIWGAIHYVGEMLDEETRSLEIIIECDNADRELKLGMFCEVHSLSSPVKALLLPSTAVMQEGDDGYVLIEVAKGKYLRRKVEAESVGQENVRITGGLGEDEVVVVKGGIYLNM